jgi:hypothetical protein
MIADGAAIAAHRVPSSSYPTCPLPHHVIANSSDPIEKLPMAALI